MKSRVTRNHQGQALVEFALVILVLMFIIFVLIEASRLFQANLTVQKAAREAGRYAITGQFETDCLLETPPCGDPRVESVRRVAEKGLAGLPLNPDADARMREPNAYLVEVMTPADDGSGWIEGVGDPGAAVLVRVLYEANMVTPLVRPIADVVRVTGQVVMNNERVTQVSGTTGDVIAPDLPPPPPPPPPPDPPDVQLTKTGPTKAVGGSTFSYTLVVKNHSDDVEVTGVRVIDTLPAELTFVSISGCSQSEVNGTAISCLIGRLAPTALQQVVLTVEAPEIDATLTNTAQVTLLEIDNDYSNNSDDWETTIETTPVETDVQILKTGPPIVLGEEEFAYRVVVANTSLVDAQDVNVVDTLPPGVVVRLVPNICSVAGNPDSGMIVNCSIATLAAQQHIEIILDVTAPATPGVIENRAEVTVGSPLEWNIGDNNTSWETEVVVLPDLQVTLFDRPDPVFVGADLTYEIIISNIGLGTATNVILDDIMPYSVDFVSATPAGACQRGGNVVSCSLGTLPPGTSTTAFVFVRPGEAATIVNTATVRSSEADRNPADNTASSSTSVLAETDLAITKTGPATAEQGIPFDYTLTVRNNGPSPATGVTVRDTLPTGMSVLSASPTQGYCDIGNNPVICSLGRLDNGEVATIVIRVVAISPGNAVNQAFVSGGETDPFSPNNTSTALTNVQMGSHFITVTPHCGEVGTQVTVNGYNWKKNQTVTLRWNGTTVTTFSAENWSTVYTIPGPLADGVYSFTAVDTQGRQASAQFTIPCPAPNLIAGQPARVGSGEIAAGQPVTFRTTIQNIGNLNAVSQFFVGIYVNPNPEPVPASTHLPAEYRRAIVAVSGLQVGQSKTIEFTLSTGLPGGTNLIYAVVDSDPGPTGLIAERRETDNISAPLQLQVSGSGPNPTPTPQPTNPGNIVGRVRNEAGNPQAFVEIWLYNASNAHVGTSFSSFDGSYYFAAVSAGTYGLTACIRIEDAIVPGVFHDYSASVPGVAVQGGGTTTQNLFLQLAPEGCPRP